MGIVQAFVWQGTPTASARGRRTVARRPLALCARPVTGGASVRSWTGRDCATTWRRPTASRSRGWRRWTPACSGSTGPADRRGWRGSSPPTGRRPVPRGTPPCSFLEEAGFPAERCAHPSPVTALDGQAVLVTTFVTGSPSGPTTPPGGPWATSWAACTLPVPSTGPVARQAGSLPHHHPGHEGGPDEDLASAAEYLASVDARVPAGGRAAFEALRDQWRRPTRAPTFGCRHPSRPGGRQRHRHPRRARPWSTGPARAGPAVTSLVVLLQSVAVGPAGSTPERSTRSSGRTGGHVAPEPEGLARARAALRLRGLEVACWMYALAVASGRVPHRASGGGPTARGPRRWPTRPGPPSGPTAPRALQGLETTPPGHGTVTTDRNGSIYRRVGVVVNSGASRQPGGSPWDDPQ